ncbi:hypothetical protein [Glycomyces halotolerans]
MAYLAVAWTGRGDAEDPGETVATTEDPTAGPSAAASSQPMPPNALFLVEWPEGQCDELTELLAPSEHVGPESIFEHIDEFGAVVAPRCTFRVEDEYTMATAGEPYFWFQIDVEIGSPEAFSASDPELFQQLDAHPSELDPADWQFHLKDRGQREVPVDCTEDDNGCVADEEATVQAEYFEFWAAYGNLYVEFHVNFYNADTAEGLSEQAAGMYGEVFELLAASIPQERD